MFAILKHYFLFKSEYLANKHKHLNKTTECLKLCLKVMVTFSKQNCML